MSLTHQLFLQSLRELAGFEQKAFDAHRLPLIASLVDHAWREVPAYRARLAAQVIDQSLDLARWCELPLLRRSDILALGAALAARELPPEAADVEEAPDQPPPHRRSRLTVVAAECERERFYELNGLDLAAPLAVLHPDLCGPQQGFGWSITFAKSKWFAGDCYGDAEAQLAWLGKSGAKLLRTNAAIGERIAKACEQAHARLPLQAIIIADTDLAPARRAAIESAMQVAVSHLVGHPELGTIAASDPEGGYVVAAATCVVEVVAPDGRPAAEGAVGELVVTPLYEYAVPRLRFATGIKASPQTYPGTLIGVRRLAGVGNTSE